MINIYNAQIWVWFETLLSDSIFGRFKSSQNVHNIRRLHLSSPCQLLRSSGTPPKNIKHHPNKIIYFLQGLCLGHTPPPPRSSSGSRGKTPGHSEWARNGYNSDPRFAEGIRIRIRDLQNAFGIRIQHRSYESTYVQNRKCPNLNPQKNTPEQPPPLSLQSAQNWRSGLSPGLKASDCRFINNFSVF